MGAILHHFGYPTPSLTEWQQHVWYDLGAIHSCVYEMQHRLAMGCPPQPHSASSIASVTTSASPVESHPRAGRKTPRAPPESTPATPSIGQPAETFPQSSPAKDKDKRKKRKRKEDDASSRRPKKHKKRASPVASSDTEIYENPIVKKEEASASVPPPESSDSQAEGPFTNRSDSEGTESAPESKKVSSSHR